KLVKKRGELMKNSGEVQQGTMAAIIGMSGQQVEEICRLASVKGIVQAANFNCPGQIVISGDVTAVEEAMLIAKAEPFKCRLAKRLEVSGAFHSELMRTSDKDLRTALDEARINDSAIPVYTNVSGQPITNSEEIRSALKDQLTSPVKWEVSIRNMIADGITKFYEIGSGKVLTGLVKKINPDAEIFNVSTFEDLSNL
ncbi:MAG TPA: ACP S-malonyltransferase, partial [Ignavibacteria bacterium]|nr:ACP S-malonyltransferase [Ignavibacteria bacterium]